MFQLFVHKETRHTAEYPAARVAFVAGWTSVELAVVSNRAGAHETLTATTADQIAALLVHLLMMEPGLRQIGERCRAQITLKREVLREQSCVDDIRRRVCCVSGVNRLLDFDVCWCLGCGWPDWLWFGWRIW